jgi:formate dehydrogenase subunit gamma
MQDAASLHVEAVLARLQHEPGALLPILHAIQDTLGHVPASAVPAIATALNLSRAEVHGVVSFYHHFRTAPPGRHVVQLCRAEACQSMGGEALAARLRERLGIDFHQTTADGRITLEPVYCLGQCACAPAALVDGEVHGRLSGERAADLLAALE